MTGRPVSARVPHESIAGVLWVAWHGGGAHTLRVGRRHLTRYAGPQGDKPRVTLCGRRWQVSREVTPNDYWTTGDCARCVRALETSS